MKKSAHFWILLLLVLPFWGCSDNSTSTTTEEASAEKQFVWNAMNYWYYWQGDVPELADNYFENDQAFQEYLNGFNDAEAVFNALTYDQEDRFSFFIDNYEEFAQSQQGISKSFGFEYGLVRLSNSNNIFGYVQYVLKDSPAEKAGLVRGDIFTRIGGTQLTVNNYRDLLLDKENYELGMAEIQDNTLTDTGQTINLQAVELTEDPVFISSVLQRGSTKIGYLMYNAFHTNTHKELNDIFGNFLSEGIDELVLDLRYNGGGAGITSQTLAGLISGQSSSNVFATYTYNDMRAADWNHSVSILDSVPIFDENGEQQSEAAMNQLSIDRVYILTGFGTASASELLINGLKPYMDVTIIGDQTVGKDQGSYTLYDAPSPYLDETAANPDHKIAIQPIVLKLVNKNGEDYPDGFTPDYAVDELDSLASGLPALGSENDPLLAKALEVITGGPVAKTSRAKLNSFSHGEIISDSRDLEPYSKQLYLQPDRH